MSLYKDWEMTGYIQHPDIVIQGNHLMQSHAVVVSVLQSPYRVPLHANRPQYLRPILIQDHAPDQPSRAVFPPPSLTRVCGTSFLPTLTRIGACLLGLLYSTEHNTFLPSSRAALELKPSLRVVVRTKTENEDEGNIYMPIRPNAMALRKRRSRRGRC